MSCPCGSGQPFEACCGPILAGAPAQTAEALMRSRYTAYVRGDIDHVLATHDPETVGDVDRAAAERWSRSADWRGLTVLATERGGEGDDEGIVEFKVVHATDGVEQVHHERSTFRRVNGQWRFVRGARPPVVRAEKVGRNDPCPCGSGKKFKKCHGS